MTLCNNNDQTWFSDELKSAGPLGVVQHNPPGPADPILLHKKPCCTLLIAMF